MIGEVRSRQEWSDVLALVDQYDFHHTFDYHVLSARPEETPIMLVYRHADVIIAIPLLELTVPGSTRIDFNSVYGYGGPVSRNVFEDFDNRHFVAELHQYLESRDVVTVFSRLHPYIEGQTRILASVGELVSLGAVVNIDVSLPHEQSRARYSKTLKTEVNRLRRVCSVRKAGTREELRQFVAIYHETMDRVLADDKYYFDEAYFSALLEQRDFDADLLIVQDNQSGRIIAGAVFIKTGKIVQYHLSGTSNEFLWLNPSKLLLDEMRLIATAEGYRVFNLGGGLGGQTDDSLFHFKSCFSKQFHPIAVWRYVVDQHGYRQLNELYLAKVCDSDNSSANSENHSFPLYRSYMRSVRPEQVQ